MGTKRTSTTAFLRIAAGFALVATVVSLPATSAFGDGGGDGGNGAHGVLVANAGSPVSCASRATFSTIQSAVNAATPGETIRVCPGTYQEYVTVPVSLSGLSIVGQDTGNAQKVVILFPTVDNTASLASLHADSLVTVDGATNVTIRNVEISGPYFDTGCQGDTTTHYGVYVGGGGQANIVDDLVTNITDSQPGLAGLGGCQDGIAIAAGNDFFSSNSYPQDPGAVTVVNSVINNYQKDGIYIDGGASAQSSVVRNNVITGVGPTAVIGSNGIELDDNSTGTITDNTISANQYTPSAYQASAILLYAPGPNVVVARNDLSANDIGIYAYSPGSGLTIRGNQITGDATNADSEGIQLDNVTGAEVANNQVTAGAYGIDLFDGTTGVVVHNNQISNVTQVGLLDQGTTPVTNSSYGSTPAVANTFSANSVSASGVLDCQDATSGTLTSATANTWIHNGGTTSSPVGLCAPRGHGD